jgi:hypothetical protein
MRDLPPLGAHDATRALGPAAGARRRRWTHVGVAVEAAPGSAPAPVRYQWDADTELLAASLVDRHRGRAADATSLQLEGRDGSWITLELRAGRLCGLEVAVWPPVRLRSTVAPPATAEAGHVTIPAALAPDGAGDVEVDTLLAVEADRQRRTYHFRLGRPRPTRAVRVGRDILVDVDEAGELAGLWLLHVPAQPIPH